MSLIERIRQPEYTGENRCIPCTIVNVLITAVVGGVVAIASTIGGLGVFGVGIATIYLRGYLVPGTPTLTKRYFPDRVLRWFDKEPGVTDDANVQVDTERILLSSGAVEVCAEETDLCLTEGFREAWWEQIESDREKGVNNERIKRALTVRSRRADFTVEEIGDGIIAQEDESVIGQWGSGGAIIADVAAAAQLDERLPVDTELSPAEMSRVLASLRIFLDRCPECGGEIGVDQEAVESCCRSYEVLASKCRDCDTRMFEMEWDDEMATETDPVPA